jgi:hypothetical protein
MVALLVVSMELRRIVQSCRRTGLPLARCFPPYSARPIEPARTQMETVMSNFQRLLESPFHWAADFAGGFLKHSRGTERRRRERMLRREYLNG